MFEDVTVLAKWQPKPAGASGPGASLRRIRPDSTCSATTRGRVWARARETGRARLGEECWRDGYGDERGGEGRKAGEDRDCDGFGHLQPLHLRAGAWRVSQPLAPISCGQRCQTLARARTGTESFVGFLQCRCRTWSISAAAPPRDREAGWTVDGCAAWCCEAPLARAVRGTGHVDANYPGAPQGHVIVDSVNTR